MRNCQNKSPRQHPNNERWSHSGRDRHGIPYMVPLSKRRVAPGGVLEVRLAALDPSQACSGLDPTAHHEHVLIEAVLGLICGWIQVQRSFASCDRPRRLCLRVASSDVLCAHVTSCCELAQTPKAAHVELLSGLSGHILWQPAQGSNFFHEVCPPHSGLLRLCGSPVALLWVLLWVLLVLLWVLLCQESRRFSASVLARTWPENNSLIRSPWAHFSAGIPLVLRFCGHSEGLL